MKRFFDVTIAAIGLLVLLPFAALLSLAVRRTTGRPVFFRQVRVGRNGKDFNLVKFRTMTVKSEAETGSFQAGDRSRITPIGAWLRQTKLDELPQLWNVLRGDMSLVGPRPEVREWVDVYRERWRLVHNVRPGITDPASIAYRHEEELLAASSDPESTYRNDILPKKLALYEQYVDNHSFLGDLRILARTLIALIRKT